LIGRRGCGCFLLPVPLPAFAEGRRSTIAFFAALGLPGFAGFVSEAMTLIGAFQADDPRFQVLVAISAIGLLIGAAYLLWAMQRVFLGNLDAKYSKLTDINLREVFSQAPLLILCVVLGIFPFLLLDPMGASVTRLVALLRGTP
jgi:NADH-quinone oxidoreductase subunit M